MESKEKDNLFFKGSFQRRGEDISAARAVFDNGTLNVVATENKIAAQSGSGKC